MQTVNIHEAKTHFSKLIDAVMQGEEIIIAKAGKPAAKLIAFSRGSQRRFGVLAGKFRIADDFDAPLPEDFFSDFNGGE